ncbi:MAG: Gx transporter family protein, partial [Parasporobacterium sp.]|nr:Gx transporter family protein [Parasporobacterium sp.]
MSYVESLLPLNFGIPGVKLGLANIVIVAGMYLLPVPYVCIISLVRILLSR